MKGSHSWVLLENAKKNLIFHFWFGRHASFPQKPVVKGKPLYVVHKHIKAKSFLNSQKKFYKRQLLHKIFMKASKYLVKFKCDSKVTLGQLCSKKEPLYKMDFLGFNFDWLLGIITETAFSTSHSQSQSLKIGLSTLTHSCETITLLYKMVVVV